MERVNLELDEEILSRARQEAMAAGIPVDEWLAKVLAERISCTWPSAFQDAAGAWRDMPDVAPAQSYDFERRSW